MVDDRTPGGTGEVWQFIVSTIENHAWEMAWLTVGVLTEKGRAILAEKALPKAPIASHQAVRAAKLRVCMFDPRVTHQNLSVEDCIENWGSKNKETLVILRAPNKTSYVVIVAREGDAIVARIDEVSRPH